MRPFILVVEADTGQEMIIATKDIAVVTQTATGSNISFSGMHHDIDTLNPVRDIWSKIHPIPEARHG